MIDLLLNHLHDENIINVEADNIRFIGFGYGAHIVASYCKKIISLILTRKLKYLLNYLDSLILVCYL